MRSDTILMTLVLISFATFAQEPDKPRNEKPSIDGVIRLLRDRNREAQQRGLQQLGDLQDDGVSETDAMKALRAAFEKFPDGFGKMEDPAERLIGFASVHPSDEGVAIIRQGMARLSAPGKAAAIEYLVLVNTPQSIDSFAVLFRKHRDELEWYPSKQSALVKTLPNDVVSAVLVESLAHGNVAGLAAAALLEGAEQNSIGSRFFVAHVKEIGEASNGLIKKIAPTARQQAPTQDERWKDEYQDVLGREEYLADLLGHAGAKAEPYLRRCLEAKDPRISCFAILSLIRIGCEVEPVEVQLVAADDEMRNTFFNQLEKLGRTKLFPKEYRTQEAFARSEMVRWLVYPTELGRPPDQIELMKVVDTPVVDDVMSVYVYRFRTVGLHWAAKDGWMAGIAGAYAKSQSPTTHARGQTFSKFESYASKTPEEHVGDIQEMLKEWNRKAR